LNGELIDNRIVVWNIKDSQKLFTSGYYGKPIGISKPKFDEINVPLILDLIEGYYLLQNSKIKIKKMIINQSVKDATIFVDPSDNGIRIYGKWKSSYEFGITKEMFSIYDKIAGHIKSL